MAQQYTQDHAVGDSRPSDNSLAVRPVPPSRLGALIVLLAAIGLIAGGYVVHVQLPLNAVTLPYETQLRQPVQQLLPEGWAFFTRSPREADLLPYTEDGDGRWRSALLAPHSLPRNAFGLARASRAQGVEMGLLTGELRGSDWRDCKTQPTVCLDQAPTATVHNRAYRKTLCGQVGLVQQPPVPWAWSRAGDDITMPSKVARLEVSC